jgi:pimeloyl-ACP methyl ester carboxylesterase
MTIQDQASDMSGSSTRTPGRTGAMDRATLDGVELEYELKGSGEPVLLIPPGPAAGGFLPFLFEPALVDRYRLIRYHRRGQAGSTRAAPPVSFADHAADAASLLDHLGVRRAHVAGHSTGGAIALQLALDHPEVVETLALLEPPLFAVRSAEAFLKKAESSLQAYAAGDSEAAMAGFLSVVSGLDWEACRAVLDEQIPGGASRAFEDADFFFGIDLPAINAWTFGPEQAASIAQPMLSVLGTESERVFVEGADLLRSWFPQIDELTLEGAGHLLHIQRPEPVARSFADFFGRHPIAHD